MNAATQETERIKVTIENWKRKLLDISKRNRALNFKPNKVTTITILDEQPAEVFRQLYIRGKAMRFNPAPERPGDKKQGPDTDVVQEQETEDVFGRELDFVPYDVEQLSANYSDDLLQTASSKENLDRSLRRIDDQARASIDEQGVNTLFLALGMLYYKESSSSDETLRAPLILLPVGLNRKSAHTGYTVKVAEDEPIVNPALNEYLRRSFGITLPELPDLTNLPEDYDLQKFFVDATEVISNQKDWQVKRSIYLSFFSFQKFTMYKDLEVNSAVFGNQRHIQQIVLRSGTAIRSLPDEILQVELDHEFAPERTAQVANADSSQLRAILAVSRSQDVVIEGPPGTGKSQTITNLIAQAIAENKSVLFVAEKMAALEVVYNRLVGAGLGEFCLELHSTKANKRSVMQQIAAALDASLQNPKKEDIATARIGVVREELTNYANLLHEPFGALDISPYQGYGEFERVREAPKARVTIKAENVTREQLMDTERELNDLAKVAERIGIPAEHPWRDTTRTYYSEQDLDTARDRLSSISSRLSRIVSLAAAIEKDLGLPLASSFSEIKTTSAIAEVMSHSPGAPLTVLQSDLWNSPPPHAVEIVNRGRAFLQLNNRLRACFSPDTLDQDHAADISFIEAKENSPLAIINFLSGRFRAVKNRWLGYRLPGYAATLLEQAAEMRKIETLRREKQAIDAYSSEAPRLFGDLWQGVNSDWEALSRYIQWVAEFRRACVANKLKEQAQNIASHPRPNMSMVAEMVSEAEKATQELATFRTSVGWPADYLSSASFNEITERVEALIMNLNLAPRWAAFEQVRSRVAVGLAAELLTPVDKGEVSFNDLVSTFHRAFFQCWLNEAMQHREALRAFNTMPHEQRVAEFRRLDELVLAENRSSLVQRRRYQTQRSLQSKEIAESFPFLRHQLTLQRGLSPLRITFKRSAAAIRSIKPVFMMSPLSVAQLLDAGQSIFDLVIFDEASQLPTEDSVGAIARGRQLVVVGDPKQLPPTNFFSVMSGTVSAETDEDGVPLFQDSESILETFMGSGAPMSRLKWHYRSAHESLINFSNVSFYDSDLFTFPSVEIDSDAKGLKFEFVDDGVYEGKGLNLKEARRVADAVVQHIKTTPELSLGVGTFNMRQQIAIQDELELRRRQDSSIEFFFVRDKNEPFFVKNLENIQGDERDVIFISVTYAKDASGVMRYNFGPLNGQNGRRRLNVLITRARKSMRVFSSIKGHDINPANASSEGPRLLREFLIYAETGRLDNAVVKKAAETENIFEREVYLELSQRGLKLQPQVGIAGYKIDFGVLDDAVAGRYICGIECDGAAYHSSETARDRDRLRQQVLEGRGWTIHRLWSTDWFKDRHGQIERLMTLVERSKQVAIDEKEAEVQAKARLAVTATQEQESLPGNNEIDSADDFRDANVSSQAIPYTFADTPLLHPGLDLNESPASLISRAIDDVVAVESPIHTKDLASRVAARWGNNVVGPNMMRRILTVITTKAQNREIDLRGDFVFASASTENIPVRSRVGTNIPADRIAPEEYRAAILMVLNSGDGLDRKLLTNKVRALFGFNRTGAQLESAIGSAIDKLLSEEKVGEGSTGIRLRK